ncbi:hypothetical protein [Nocardia sp. NPDC051570]|uniref:hypothetical protein n=1 Tax=Nocardia sp. NPDC051570 TaxID=3364324 RepID=UPI0037A892F6
MARDTDGNISVQIILGHEPDSHSIEVILTSEYIADLPRAISDTNNPCEFHIPCLVGLRLNTL